MRNSNRISEMLNLLSELWLRNPDLRFNQLIYLLQSEFSNANGGIGQVIETDSDGLQRKGFDLFNLEDEQFIDYLRKTLSNHEKT